MNKIFRSDNPFWMGMGSIFDIFVLNLLWLLCCLPIVTIGPSTTALFYAMMSLVRGEGGYVSHDFFHSFRQNLKQGIFLGLPLTAVGAFLMLDISLCYHAGTGIYTFFMVFFAVLFLFWLFVALYAFPLLAKFEKKNKEIVIWAFVLSIRNLGRTLLMIIVLALGLWACHILPGLVFIAFGLICRFQAASILTILKPYLPDVSIEEELEPLEFLNEEDDRKEHGYIDERE